VASLASLAPEQEIVEMPHGATGSYRLCARCVMDTTDPEISFDSQGVCSHCKRYDARVRAELFVDTPGREALDRLVARIKEAGKGREYDCLLGVSGGVDSTAVAYTARQLGLRPLAVHLDNGWDSELSVKNIECALKTLEIDLYSHVVDWEEFKDLHLSFLKASVANSEIPTDHAIIGVLYGIAAAKGIRYILGGGNIATEGIMPTSWMYDAKDLRHLRAIHRRFGSVPLKTFPCFSLWDFFRWTFVKKIRMIPILNYVSYNREEAVRLFERELGWRDYGGKHYESIYTKFFQAYILPTKFGIDKRRPHYSSQVCAGHLTRDKALKALEHPLYTLDALREDREYVLKKLGLTEAEFEAIMREPAKSYRDYPSNDLVLRRMPALLSFVKRVATARPHQARGKTRMAGINLHVHSATFQHESRLLKETRALHGAGFFEKIVIAAMWEEGLKEQEPIDAGREIVRLPVRGWRRGGMPAKIIRQVLWSARVFRRFRRADLAAVNCHTLSLLPLCVLLKKASGAVLVYDTHELETETIGSTGVRRIAARAIEAALIRQADQVIVVSESIAEWYRETYDIPVAVIRNLPDVDRSEMPRSNILKDTLGLGPETLLFLYHGLLCRGRGIELLLRAFRRAGPDRHVAFMGYGVLEGAVRDAARSCPRIHFLPAVRPDEVVSYAQGADVGLCLIEPFCLSYRYCLPNKLFEYITAGLPVAVSDLPDMARVVDAHECGWKVALDEDSVLSFVNGVTREDLKIKASGSLNAAARLRWSDEAQRLVALYEPRFIARSRPGSDLAEPFRLAPVDR
jgi:N-acetyl sugar amidotransferase